MTSDNLILFNTAEQLSSRKHWTAFSIHPFSKTLILYRVAGFVFFLSQCLRKNTLDQRLYGLFTIYFKSVTIVNERKFIFNN